jgi:hypothetical protein
VALWTLHQLISSRSRRDSRNPSRPDRGPIALSPTAGLSALTLFDAAILWMTWREWRKRITDHDFRPGG